MPTDAPKSTPICTEMRGSCDGATDYASVLARPPPVTHPRAALDASGSESELAPRYRQPYLGGQQPRRKTAVSDPGKGRTGGPGKVCQQGIDHSPTTPSTPSAPYPRYQCARTSRYSRWNSRTSQPPHDVSGPADARCGVGLRWTATRPGYCPLTEYPCSEIGW